jgi:hypothetical protein
MLRIHTEKIEIKVIISLLPEVNARRNFTTNAYKVGVLTLAIMATDAKRRKSS